MKKVNVSRKNYNAKAAKQKLIAVKGVKTAAQYAELMCNPRLWAIPHINDKALLGKIALTEKTPIILARIKARIKRLTEKKVEKKTEKK